MSCLASYLTLITSFDAKRLFCNLLKVKSKTDPKREAIEEGYKLLRKHPIFRYIMHDYRLDITNKERLGKESAAISDSNGHICLNKDMSLSPAEWAYKTEGRCFLRQRDVAFELSSKKA